MVALGLGAYSRITATNLSMVSGDDMEYSMTLVEIPGIMSNLLVLSARRFESLNCAQRPRVRRVPTMANTLPSIPVISTENNALDFSGMCSKLSVLFCLRLLQLVLHHTCEMMESDDTTDATLISFRLGLDRHVDS